MKQREKRVTIKTIADAMGVSFSTVAKALNNDPLLKKETREAVVQKAKEMGYAPNMSAKSLRSNKSNTVGMILNDVENPTFAHMLSVFAGDLALMGYAALICDSRYNESIETLNIQAMLSRNIEALIISPVNANGENLKLLKRMEAKTIVLSDQIPGFHSNYVKVDYALGGYLAAKMLLDNGHSQNLIMSEMQMTNVNQQYVAGVRKAYVECGVDFDEASLYHTIPSIDAGCRIFMNHLRAGKRMTGVLCICDSLAYGVYQATEKLNLRIPDDVSVVGFDDYAPSQFFSPKLTTLHFPKEQMTGCCMDLLRDVLVGRLEGPRTIMLEPYMVERNTVKNGGFPNGFKK